MDDLQPPLPRRLTRAQLIAADLVVALIVSQISIAEVVNHAGHRLPAVVAVGVVLVLAASVTLRRWRPRAMLAFALVASSIGVVAGFLRDPLLALALVLYVVALTSAPRGARIALVAVEGAIVLTGGVSWLTGSPDSKWDFMVGAGVIQLAAWMVGAAARKQREYTQGIREQLRRRAEAQIAVAQAQTARAQQAVAEERLRIARELHDVVAHSMSLIAVQAGVGHHVIASRPEEAAKSLAAIETTSRATLQEMRRLLGMLRDGTQPDAAGCDAEELQPAPGLADLPALLRQTRQAGLRTDLQIVGTSRTLHPGVELAAYRIVQEALTNVVKHADTDRGRVVITYAGEDLRLEVTDDGARHRDTGGVAASRPGHGLIGMRERVALYGGQFDAGPLPGRGFRVTAWLPVGDVA